MSKVTRLTGGEGEDSPQRLHLREIPGEAKPAVESVGQELRTTRLKRGDELGDVSQALRIGKDYLEALESDCPGKLPGRTYAIGFVRSYASYLGLDAAAVVSRYKLATMGLPESAPRVGPAPEPASFHLNLGWTLPVLAVAAAVVYGIYELSLPRVPAESKPVPAPARVAAHATATTGKPQASHAVRRVAPAVTAAAAPPVGNTAIVPTGEVFGAQNRGVRVVVHGRELTHVLVEGPGGKVYLNRLLHPGDAYRVPNLVGLTLTTPNGGAVSLELDGRDIGVAGREGRIVEALSLDPAIIVDRKAVGVSDKADKVTP